MNKRLAAFLLCALPLAAYAHPGHAEHGFIAGLLHPFLGLDHLLAMLLVGMYSILRSRHARDAWRAPATFIAGLSGGALLGQLGVAWPPQEALIATSVLAFAVMLATPQRRAGIYPLLIIGGFALCHGIAHGGELGSGSAVLAGIICGSAVLHGCGMIFAQQVLSKRPQLTQRLAQLLALVGGGLLVSAMI